MTREEALTEIKERVCVTECVNSSYVDCVDIEALRMAIKALEQTELRWIPVTEKLPEDEYVLISKKPTKLSGSKWCVTVAIRMADPRSGKIQWRDSGFGVIQDDEVLAWMPRPKPYRKEGENQ